MSAAEELFGTASADAVAAECIAFVGDNQAHGTVAAILQQYFAEPVVRDGGSQQALAFLAEAPAPQVLIVDTGANASPLTDLLAVRSALPDGSSLIGLGDVNDISLYREMMDAGISDYLTKPVTEKALASALLKTERPPAAAAEQPEAQQRHRIAVIGSRGGVGSSAIAVNLAWLLAEQRKRKTALVDLDLEFGTIALAMDIEPTRGLREALENPARIDSLFVSSATAKLSEHFSIMATEELLNNEIDFNPAAIDVLLDVLDRSNEIVVLDIPRPAFRIRHKVLELATHLVLVTELSLPGLRDSIRLLNSVKESNEELPVIVVANRTGGSTPAMQAGDFQKALGHKIDIVVPDAPKVFNQAANLGRPAADVDKKGKLFKAVNQLADRLQVTSTAVKHGGKGVLRRLMNRG